MNQYGSVIRTLTARNVIEKSIAPPSDLTIAPADCIKQIFEAGQRNPAPNSTFKYYTESNIILHRLGVFSNFADGMVWKTPYSRMGLRVSFVPYSVMPATTGTVALSSTSKQMTGTLTQFNTPGPNQLFPGDVILVGDQPASVQGPLFIVESVASDLLVNLTDYGINVTGKQVKKLDSTSGVIASTVFYGLENFNTMYDHETFIPISTLGGTLPLFYISVRPELVDDTLLMTRTIDTSYGREIAYFDVKADFEFSISGSNI